MTEDAVELGDALPRAAFALVFFPNDVAQGGPDFWIGLFKSVPGGIAFLSGGENGPATAEEIAAIIAFSFRGVFVPFVAFHAGKVTTAETGGEPEKRRNPELSLLAWKLLSQKQMAMGFVYHANTAAASAEGGQGHGWRDAGSGLLDWLYPPICAVCEAALTEGRSLCGCCEREMPRLAEPFCERCGEMFSGSIDGDFSCPNCRDLAYAFDFVRPAISRDERLMEMIHQLKYGRQIHLAAELGRLAAEAFLDRRLEAALRGRWKLVPVPLHRSRLQQRYFNQAYEIACGISKVTGLPVCEALQRRRATQTQTKLSRKERLANLKGALDWSAEGRQWLKSGPVGVVLVDDVFTTGATLDACAAVLRKGGIPRVLGVTVMRG